MVTSETANPDDVDPAASASRRAGANAYNSDLPWAYRCTWDRAAFESAYPEHTFGRVATRVDAERAARYMLEHQSKDKMPLVAVAVMGPDESDWETIAHRPEPEAVDGQQ